MDVGTMKKERGASAPPELSFLLLLHLSRLQRFDDSIAVKSTHICMIYDDGLDVVDGLFDDVRLADQSLPQSHDITAIHEISNARDPSIALADGAHDPHLMPAPVDYAKIRRPVFIDKTFSFHLFPLPSFFLLPGRPLFLEIFLFLPKMSFFLTPFRLCYIPGKAGESIFKYFFKVYPRRAGGLLLTLNQRKKTFLISVFRKL